MSGAMFGGDEVGALVLDIGSATTRFGFAGEDTPKSVFPSVVGLAPSHHAASQDSVPMDTSDRDLPSGTAGGAARRSRKSYVGTTTLAVVRSNVDLAGVMQNGLVEDWERFELLADYGFATGLRVDAAQHPLLMIEPSWNPRESREHMTELFFEKYNVPAFYLARSAVASAFANGRPTGLVLDIGASLSSAVPVVDGFVMPKSIMTSSVGGDFLLSQCAQYLEKNQIVIRPSYMVASKQAVALNAAPKWTPRTFAEPISDSFHRYSKQLVLQDFVHSVLFCSGRTFDRDSVANLPAASFEFPDGLNISLGADRYRLAETLFDPETHADATAPAVSVSSRASSASAMDATSDGTKDPAGGLAAPKPIGLHRLATAAINSCDVDVRPSIGSSVIVVGGGSLVRGLPERLDAELRMALPAISKLKTVASGLSVERMFSSWIGGSILASLGSFQQMWMSKQEYEESGKAYIEKKCV
ncbi:BAF53b [Capsaspora owczarzaki ATCC 30864]|uniref:BAF53b n=1 Tax=Capsaspora owczarzaki (strain ATCC 30864) TaxID=595528 RepID=A0A0D2X0I4_CAPO3|nr:BAF53b [Capsaspora owczarzaki ATCC 30864]KJE89114.1 BAF53b [Capsaspora owczarzaki ATCC 30864]|eukprot:XP_004365527.2 BAF53b [Capsaspora owczarzaki ATCC 30864]